MLRDVPGNFADLRQVGVRSIAVLHHDHVGLPDDGPYLDRFRAVWTGSITAVGKAW
jgi:hypothetical protein